jgi:erythromycin esterase
MHRIVSLFRRFYLIPACLLVLTLTGCMQGLHLIPTSSHPVVDWIQQHAIPLQTTNQGSADADLAPLQQIVGNASIVGLGEETHGTHEVIDLKARLAEFLISTMGFTTFVMENSWGMSQIVNKYIHGGLENINEVMSTGLFTSWQTQEYQTLLEWMRAYNANPAHRTKIQFLGMDCQTVSQSDLNTVENYIKTVDPQQATYVQQRYAPITTSNPLALYDTLSAAEKQHDQDQAQQVYNLLQKDQKAYSSRSSAQSYALALQTARVIVQFTTYYNHNLQSESLTRYIQRDSFMADNVMWIYDHAAGSHPKIIVWAHNAHIANNPSYYQTDRNMGNYLATQYKKSYVPIGTTLYQGSLRTYPTDGTENLATPTWSGDTYNYTLGQTDYPLYMLDLRKIPSGPVKNWVSGPAILNLYGLGGENLSAKCKLNTMFDVIIHIQNSTPAQPLFLE